MATALYSTAERAAASGLVADSLDDGTPAGWTAFDTSTADPTPSAFENAGGNQFCNDQIDNDQNGLTDCLDPACFGIPPCGPVQVPAVSTPSGLILLCGILGIGGLLALARTRRRHRP